MAFINTLRKIAPAFLLLLVFAPLKAQSLALNTHHQATKKRIIPNTITPEMIAKIRYISSSEISPDGQSVAYTVFVPGGPNDPVGSSHHELWITSSQGGEAIQYIGKPNRLYNLRWSPDGKHLYFLSYRKEYDSHTQIYRIATDGGEAVQLSNESNHISSFELSPDGTQIAFTMKDPKSDEEKSNEKAGKDWVVYGENLKYNRLYLASVERPNWSSSKIFSENLHISSFTWSPDNQTLAFTAAKLPVTDHIYMFQSIYKVNTSEGKPIMLCETEGKLGHPSISPDGKTLAWPGAVDLTDPLPQSLFTVSMDGGNAKNHTPGLKASVEKVYWLNSETILMHAYEGVYSSLYKVNTSTGKKEKVYGEGAIIYSISLDDKKEHLALKTSSQRYPSNIMTGKINSNNWKVITNINPELNRIELNKQEVIEWQGPGKWEIQGILTYPSNYQPGKKYPLILQIHGGPEGISTNGWNTRAVYPVQYLAQNGYFVLEPNYRGSKGKGVAFSKGDHKDLAGKEFEDVLAGIDYLVKKGMVDAERVGTGGFSYGGYFSAWAATKHSKRFKAAIMGAGISNWISFSGTTDIIYENSHVHWNLWWYDHMELVWDRSPLAHINNAQTPTLIIHGEKDLRVPITQGEELYNALKLKGVPAEMVMYKRQPHGIREYAAQIDYMERSLQWFNKHLTKDRK